MDFENISDELKAKAKECATPEELLELAKTEGYELSEEDLDAISGGDSWLCPSDACLGYTCKVVCSVGSARPPKKTHGGKHGLM